MELSLGKLNDQGIHECEVWTTDAEGEKEWMDCKKNPGHKTFIPVKEFSMEHLPEPFRDDDVLEYVRLICERTVRLIVKYTSPDRPFGYAFYNYRGKKVPHTGSGLVYCYEYPEDDVEEEGNENSGVQVESEEGEEINVESVRCDVESDDDSDDDFKIYEYFDLQLNPCPCPECSQTKQTRQGWGYVYVFTAKHVVFDKVEAENTTVELNFDAELNTKCIKRIYGNDITIIDDKVDCTMLQCITHDRELYIKLYDMSKRFSELKDLVHEKYWESPSRLSLIVSHPHGWVKKVTLGEWTSRSITYVSLNGDEQVGYTYNTDTCRGSSGAPVLILGMRGSDVDYKTWLAYHHVHSGANGPGENISGVETETRIDFDSETDSQDKEVSAADTDDDVDNKDVDNEVSDPHVADEIAGPDFRDNKEAGGDNVC